LLTGYFRVDTVMGKQPSIPHSRRDSIRPRSSVEEAFLQALHAEPNDEATWLALADWLEEQDQPERAELVRLMRRLRTLPVMRRGGERARLEDRVAELLCQGVRPVVPEVVNSIGMRFALIPPGRFRMGSPTSEKDRLEHEGPLHEVEITRAFYLGVFPVTQRQYKKVMGSNPSDFSATGIGRNSVAGMDTSAFPVEQVSWDEAIAFVERLSALPKEKKSGRKYRLPSEAEWEYGCRGGSASSTPFAFGNRLSPSQANFNGNYPYGGAEKGPSLDHSCKAGSYAANVFGLYDMHGNVWEWCNDWFADDYYAVGPREDPPGPSGGSTRVFRGGGWISIGQYCRSAIRNGYSPANRYNYLGFRVALVPSGP
jgi:uncharacterized protein (TIGR02996 family)